MQKKHLLFIITTIYICFSACVLPVKNNPSIPTTNYTTKHVVVLVIDGPRYTETYGDSTYQYIPNLGKVLSKEGVLYTNFRNNGPTYTNAGHTAITTGNYQGISNAGKELPKNPSIFNYYLKQSGCEKDQAWIVSSKGKLEILANTKNADWWNTYMPMTYCGAQGNSSGYEGDLKTYQQVKKVLNLHAPKLTLINLLEVDVNGHQNNWPGYLQGLRNTDSLAAEIWKLIQTNPTMKNKTTLLITNDHGRHLDGHKNGFVNHGDNCEGCRKISLLAIGPDFKRNLRLSTPAETIDISATIAELLQFQMKTTKGRVLQELFNK